MSLLRRILVERRALVLPLAVLLAVNVAVLVAVVLPLRQTVGSAEDLKNAAYARKDAATHDLQKATEMTTREKLTSQQLDTFYTKVLATDVRSAIDAVNTWPWKTAQQLGLQYTGIETSQPTEIRDSRLMMVTSRFSLKGDYANIRKFIYAVEAADQFLIIDKLKLAQPGAQQTNTAALGFEMSVTTYYLRSGK